MDDESSPTEEHLSYAMPPTFVDLSPGGDRVFTNGCKPADPVRWLSPRQLLTTAIEVLQGTVFARFADKREVMAGTPGVFFALEERADPERGVWVDYLADTGDGFNATYSVARSVMRSTNLRYGPDREGRACECATAGRVLVVMGGDEVYPTASIDDYKRKLDGPFETAWEHHAPLADRRDEALFASRATPVLALPGNHDWYDGLVAFRRVFCESWTTAAYPDAVDKLTALPSVTGRDPLGGLGAIQSRSYFAVRLTDTWWLWGLDSQLDKPIDAAQLRYFRDAAGLVGCGQKIILCTATPSWLHAENLGADSPFYTLDWFLERMPDVREKVRLILTGDKHHYAHYSPPQGDPIAPHLVTCGGGGAFMSSTHHLKPTLDVRWHSSSSPSAPATTYSRETTFPNADGESQGLSGGTTWLKVPFINGWLPVLVLAMYAVMTLVSYWGWRSVRTHDYALDRWPVTWPVLWAGVVPLALLGLLFTFALRGAGEGSRWATWVAAGLHTAAHWAPVSWLAFVLSGVDDLMLVWGWGIVAWLALTGWGLLVFATYLHLSDRVGRHELESYSGLRIEGYKCHLRLHVDGETVTVHALGIRDVPDYEHSPLDQELDLEHLETIRIT